MLLLAAPLLLIAAVNRSSKTASAPNPGAIKTNPDGNLSPSGFVAAYKQHALTSQQTTGVPAAFTLAQAGLESQWGKHAPGFNFFGIKAGKSWTGDIQKLKTWEAGKTADPKASGITDEVIKIYAPGESGNPFPKNYSYRVYGKFRKYQDASEGFVDHGRFLKGNKRYAKAFAETDPEKFARAIAAAGYASAPNYADVLAKTVRNVLKLM